MKIAFVGQTSILGNSALEGRIRALASQLAVSNHEVIIFSALEKQTRRLEYARIRYIPSLSPDRPGGWLYTLLSVLAAMRERADVIHLTSWKAACLAPLIAMIQANTTLLWTADSLPEHVGMLQRFMVRIAARLCDAITVPTRSLQYQFRMAYDILPIYIPDGYQAPTLRDIAVSRWRLKRNKYTLAIADSAPTIRQLAAAYKQVKTRRKLIVMTSLEESALKNFSRGQSRLRILSVISPRERTSLIRQAQLVVFADATIGTNELLLAMDAGRSVIAVNAPHLQEIAGTTIQFFRADDRQHLAMLLGQSFSGKKAQTRARAHFTWQRIFEDYETLYHYPLVQKVPVDSIRQSRLTQSAIASR